jgi:hypothetical protein
MRAGFSSNEISGIDGLLQLTVARSADGFGWRLLRWGRLKVEACGGSAVQLCVSRLRFGYDWCCHAHQHQEVSINTLQPPRDSHTDLPGEKCMGVEFKEAGGYFYDEMYTSFAT